MITREDFDHMTITAINEKGESCSFEFSAKFHALLEERDEALAKAEAMEALKEVYREVAQSQLYQMESIRVPRPFDVEDENAFYKQVDVEAQRILEAKKEGV